jgi:spore photoproduct lyase
MLEDLSPILENTFGFHPNKNQLRDIERLIFEIMRRENMTLEKIIEYLKNNHKIDKLSGRNRFFPLKEALIRRRFPITSIKEKIDTKNVFLSKIRMPLQDNWVVKKEFKPLRIFAEDEVKSSYLVENFRKKFPKIEIEIVNYYSTYLKRNKFSVADLKKPLVFIVKEKWDFIKPCPCTKEHLACGYWIFNLGFGCPFDCSYCFLQQYANFPGIILPANIENFFEKFDVFYKKLKHPIRIGTGEFSDSLALDDITEYSKKLIPYFKDKNVFFELKTKSNAIANLLDMEPKANIIISWSLNPQILVEKEELGSASLEERLKAAEKVQKKGYRVAFHFDPIIHFAGWEKLHKELIDELYSRLKPPFSWISLGTLRSNRQLKTMAELRFAQSDIFYGELFIGEDKKLRYPSFLRSEIYKNMVKWIREFDTKSPVYLCMENKKMWDILQKNSSSQIEKYLLEV